ncbi:MAG: hypothetical protein ACOX7K_01810 [Oscillospiraceae bacterium]|jgi:hypothetical protein
MYRVKSAYLQQTLHFLLKEDLDHDLAVRTVQEEYAPYKAKLDHANMKYQILEELTQPDGSIVVKLKKQYNNNDIGDYLR